MYNTFDIYKVDVFRKYHIEFGAETDPEANWEFLPV